MMRLLCLLLVVAITFAPASMQAQEKSQRAAPDYDLVVAVKRVHKEEKSFFEMHASAVVRATPQQAWAVLTDYGRHHEFVPNLLSSRIISRSAQETIIEQNGTRAVLFITQRIHLIVRATEHPFSSIDVALISGDMKHYATRWELTPIGPDGANGTRIIYYGIMEPDFFVPPLLGTGMVQTDVRKMVISTLLEIEKAIDKKNDAPALPALDPNR